ncbi:hypothetical protein GEMRC1_012515 [Eukaryota sp. GEM-RC1]
MTSRIQSFASLLNEEFGSDVVSGMFEEEKSDLELFIEAELKIHNVAACFNLRCAVDLRELAFGLNNATLNPRFSCLDVKLSRPQVMAKISNSGKVNIVGALSEADCIAAMRRVVKLLRRLNVPCSAQPSGFRVYQTMASAKLGRNINLDRILLTNPSSDYDVGQFLRISYKPKELQVTVQMYGSGSLVF